MRNGIYAALIFTINSVLASTLTPISDGINLGAKIEHLEFPKESLSKDLKSGFTTTLLIRLKLLEGETSVSTQEYIVSVFYDLWDEVYHLTEGSSTSKEAKTLSQLDEVIAKLESPCMTAIEKIKNLGKAVEYRIEVSAFLDPAQKDKAEVIRKWLSENSVNTGADSGRFHSASRGNPVFRSLLESYLTDGIAAAKWKTTFRSEPFKVSQIQKVKVGPLP